MPGAHDGTIDVFDQWYRDRDRESATIRIDAPGDPLGNSYGLTAGWSGLACRV